jgi:hypothetical protein
MSTKFTCSYCNEVKGIGDREQHLFGKAGPESMSGCVGAELKTQGFKIVKDNTATKYAKATDNTAAVYGGTNK